MDINEFRSIEIKNQVVEGWDFSLLLTILRDPSENLTMTDRNLIADILEGKLKRGKGAPRDRKATERQFRSCQVFLKHTHKGDKISFAYENAAKELGVSVKTVKNHIKAMRDSPHAIDRALFALASSRDRPDLEEA